jgi:hypothetical protein
MSIQRCVAVAGSPPTPPLEPNIMNRELLRSTLALLLVAATLEGCGDGGGSDRTTLIVPPTTASLILTGTAATVAAIGGRLVEAKCNGDTTGSATSLADGSFSVTVTAGQLPCVLRVSAADGTVLHSLATGSGSGSAAKANITPVSELVVANLSADAPSTYYGGFVASTAATLTQAKVDDAVKRVSDTLAAGGAALPAGVNPLTAALQAANGSTAGDDLDAALGALEAKLAAGAPGSDFKTALATLADAVAKASPYAPASALSSTASLPAAMLLQPAASNCSALRSGKYRLVYNRDRSGTDGSYDTEVFTIDAVNLTVTNAKNEVNQITANGTCRYRTPKAGDLVVSQAGIIVGQFVNDINQFHLGLAFPEQSHTLADLAGEWNGLQLDRTQNNGPIVLTNSTAAIDATGKLTAINYCESGKTCFSGTLGATPDFPPITSSVDAGGGFIWSNSRDGWTDRVFLYRTGGGELMRVGLSGAGGHLSLSTRKVAGEQATLGRVSEFWSITQNNNYTATGVSEGKNTIRSVDSTNNSYLRDAMVNLTTGVTRPETLQLNTPRDGYSTRTPETVTASDGSSSTVSQFIALGLRGTGISVVGLPSNNTVVLSISK